MAAPNLSRRAAPESRCPACGATINISGMTRRRRVQCPKCREVVELKTPGVAAEAYVETSATTETLHAELRARLDRLDDLEARVAALEKALAPMTSVRFRAIDAPHPPRHWKWVAPSMSHADAAFPEEIADALLHNLGNFDPQVLTIQATAGDQRARERAAKLKALFERAHWTVRGPREISGRGSETGLFLAVRGMPLASEAAAIYFALTASGFQLNSLLDPSLERDETVLIVA
jgi:hypothetical protein